MSHFLRDILRQPAELQKTIVFLCDDGERSQLSEAVNLIRSANHVYLTGIGSSWHAALSASSICHTLGHPVHTVDAAEMLHSATIPPGAVILVISRTGRSVEIVKLLAKAKNASAKVIAITNAADSPLGMESTVPIVIPIDFDHAISVNTYSTLAATAGILAASVAGSFDSATSGFLCRAFAETQNYLSRWQQQIAESSWLVPAEVFYFLARGSSIGSCYEARLLWEEGVKSPATAMGTASFRHGPQEIVREGMRFGIWIDNQTMRDADLAVAKDLRQLGASMMLIGQNLPQDAGDLVFQLPEIPALWQYLIDIIPAQLAAERLAGLSGVDCDSFRLCSYIVEDEYGLLREEAPVGDRGRDLKT